MKSSTFTAAAIAAGLALGGLAYGIERQFTGGAGKPAPVVALSGVSLTDTAGRPTDLAELAGRPALVFFGYTHCPDFCPTALLTAGAVLDELGSDAAGLKVVFITLDPQRDTPDVLGAYLGAFDPRIVGLTGAAADIGKAARAFGIYFEKRGAGADYSLDHTAAFISTDAGGRVAAVLPYNASAAEILAAVRKSLSSNPA